MNLYTPEDIIQDIEKFEGVKMMFTSFAEKTGKVWFLQLYSEQHEKPVPSTSTVDELNERVVSFLNDQLVQIPTPDVRPNEDAFAYVYEYHGRSPFEELKISEMHKGELKLIRTASSDEEVGEIIGSDKVSTHYVCVIDTAEREAVYMKRVLQ